MKKLLIINITILLTAVVFGQKTISVYKMLDEEFKFQASEPKDGKYDLYIYGYGLDNLYKKGGISIKYEKISKFVDVLNFSKSKYEEWTNVAKQNNVTDLTKEIEVEIPTLEGFFVTSSKVHFDFSATPYIKYIIRKNTSGSVDYSLVIYSSKLNSYENKYIEADNFIYAFFSKEEINDFIKLFDKSLVDKTFSAQKAKEDLFK